MIVFTGQSQGQILYCQLSTYNNTYIYTWINKYVGLLINTGLAMNKTVVLVRYVCIDNSAINDTIFTPVQLLKVWQIVLLR